LPRGPRLSRHIPHRAAGNSAEDIRRQIAAGAEHITFGDPISSTVPATPFGSCESLHREWPELTYDVTIKVEHLLNHRDLLPVLKSTGCVFRDQRRRSFDDAVLEKLAKGHTRADFLLALALMRDAGLPWPRLHPFTPWTTRALLPRFLRTLWTWTWRTRCHHPTGDPPADSRGLAAAGSAGNRAIIGRSTRARCVTRGTIRTRARHPLRVDSGDDQA